MGGCISISSQSSCSSRTNGEKVSPLFLGIDKFQPKRSTRTISDNVTTAQHQSSVPSRVCTNGRSRSSCVFTQQGRKGINQDAMIVWEDFMPEDVTFCGVFDGHGPHGHVISHKVRDMLPLKLSTFLNSSKSNCYGPSAVCCNRNIESDVVSAEEKAESLWRDAFLKSFKAMDKELRSYPNLDCWCSGSTAVTVVKQGNNLFLGNIGDSRAILGSKDGNDSMVATQLTVDLKPDLPGEAERIKRCKGRVFALHDEPEVPRVWLPSENAPGLAMARAFGDFCLKEYGVISVPEFSHRTLSERDKFVVLASDGVWDVLSNKEVAEIVSSARTRASAAKMVVKSATREWKAKYPKSRVDDCAVVCLYLDGKMDSDSDYEEHCLSSASTREPDDGPNSKPCLTRNFTVRSSEENEHDDTENWSGLEGVTRVNSLVQLPRFSEERTRP